MERCEECKHFGKKGQIGKDTIPFCFHRHKDIKDIKNVKQCLEFRTKYYKTSFGIRKRRHNRRAGGGIR